MGVTGASAGCSSSDTVRAVAAELRSTAAASPLEGLPHDARGVPVVAPWADPLNLQDLNRLRQIATIAARHGFADLLDRAGVFRLIGRREPVEQAPDTRAQSAARRFRRMLEDLGPTFVKLGQVLSTRADLLPAEFVDRAPAPPGLGAPHPPRGGARGRSRRASGARRRRPSPASSRSRWRRRASPRCTGG